MAVDQATLQLNKDKAMVALADSFHDFGKGERCGKGAEFKEPIKTTGFPTIFTVKDKTKDDYGLNLEDVTKGHRSAYFFDSRQNDLVGVKKGANVEATMMNYVNHHYKHKQADGQDKELYFIKESDFKKQKNEQQLKELIFQNLGLEKGTTNIGIIYDQCALKNVINKLATDYVKDSPKSTKGHIFNINPICGRWDEAGKIQVKRIDVSINSKNQKLYVPIPHTSNIRFNLKSDLEAVASTEENTPIKDNYVEIFYETGTEIVEGKIGFTKNPNVFYLRELTKNLFSFSVASLCTAYANANQTRTLAVEEAVNEILNESKLTIDNGLDPSYKDKISTFFTNKNVFNHDTLNFLNLKRSADYGQIYFVKSMNDNIDSIEMYAYNFYDEKKKIHKSGKYPVTMSLPDRLIDKWVLLTGDKLCYARARLEGVPCIFYKEDEGLELYPGQKIIETDVSSRTKRFLEEFQKVVQNLDPVDSASLTAVSQVITYTATLTTFDKFKNFQILGGKPDLFQQDKTLMASAKDKVFTVVSKYDTGIKTVFDKFNKLLDLIKNIKQATFPKELYNNQLENLLGIITKDPDEVPLIQARNFENLQSQTLAQQQELARTTGTILGIEKGLSFSECSLLLSIRSLAHESLSIDDSGVIKEDFVKQCISLNIFSPILKAGSSIHSFMLDSDLNADMKQLLVNDSVKTGSDKTKKTVKDVIAEWSSTVNKPTRAGASRTQKAKVLPNGTALYQPVECLTYVLCKEIEKGVDEGIRLNSKLDSTIEELTELNKKLSNLSPPSRGSPEPDPNRLLPGSPGPSTPPLGKEEEAPISRSPTPPAPSGVRIDPKTQGNRGDQRYVDGLPPNGDGEESSDGERNDEGTYVPGAGAKGGAIYNDDADKTLIPNFDSPSYFCLNTYLSNSKYYMYSYVTQDDLIELQNAVNIVFYICDENVKTHLQNEDGSFNNDLIRIFEQSYVRCKRPNDKTFFNSKMLVYAILKKTVISLLTRVIFNYGVEEYDKEFKKATSKYTLRLSNGSTLEVEEDDLENDFIKSEIDCRIVKVTIDLESYELLKLMFNPVSSKINLYATQDINTGEYLLDAQSISLLNDQYKSSVADLAELLFNCRLKQGMEDVIITEFKLSLRPEPPQHTLATRPSTASVQRSTPGITPQRPQSAMPASRLPGIDHNTPPRQTPLAWADGSQGSSPGVSLGAPLIPSPSTSGISGDQSDSGVEVTSRSAGYDFRSKEFYLTEYSLLITKLQKTIPTLSLLKQQEAAKIVFCIKIAKGVVSSFTDEIMPSVHNSNEKTYYDIKKTYYKFIRSLEPEQYQEAQSRLRLFGGSSRVNITKFKVQMQDYHKKYYPLYYQRYYGQY